MTKPVLVPADKVPLKHIAIIMDGNGRWAKERGLDGIAGHEAGAKRLKDVLEACLRHDIEVITLFAFSSENWQRPTVEVRALMSLFTSYLKNEVGTLVERNIRLRVIGGREKFSPRLRKLIEEAEAATRKGKVTLVMAVDYGGRWDIVQAMQQLAAEVEAGRLSASQIDENAVQRYICLGDLPEPDLCIRTAGEQRISNFLIWQMAYTEFYFADCYWPDFDSVALDRAVQSYQSRQRRFGQRRDGDPSKEEMRSA